MEHPENNPEYAGLTVNSGVGPVTSVNPHLNRNRFVRRRLTAGDYVVDAVYKANMNVRKKLVIPAAWACLHLYGDPYLKVER